MAQSRIQILLAVVVLAASMAAGWAFMNVAQRTVPLVPGIQSCWRLEGGSRQIDCLSDEFLARSDDAAGAATGVARDAKVIAYVRGAETLAAQDSRLGGVCHPAMHQLGRREGGRAAGENRVPTFPGGSSQLCTAGYVHGLAEGYLTGTPTADVVAIYPKLCQDAKARQGCTHGIGHALVRAQPDTSTDTAESRALVQCDKLPGEHATECANGVYMELAMRTGAEAIPPDTYVDRCAGASTVEHQLSCWGYLGLNLTSNDIALKDVPAWCAKATLPGQFTCIDGYGRDLGVERVAGCESAARLPELQQRCVEGAVGLQVGSGHVSAKQARNACATIDDGALSRYCVSAVQRYTRGRAIVEST